MADNTDSPFNWMDKVSSLPPTDYLVGKLAKSEYSHIGERGCVNEGR